MSTNAEPAGTDEGWRQAGAAWGWRARDWATLLEPYGAAAYAPVFSATGVGPGTQLLDIACGSGLALEHAARLGAEPAALDASEPLLEIARRRVPAGEIVAGDLFDLPWEADRFDVVTSFNGIWGGTDEGVVEMARVLRPGGYLALTFWGDPGRMDLVGYFLALAETGPPAEQGHIRELGAINDPGVAERMLHQAGLDVLERGTVTSVLHWPDAEIAWRALASPGLTVPSIEHSGEAAVREKVLATLEPFADERTGIRVENELAWIVGRKPER